MFLRKSDTKQSGVCTLLERDHSLPSYYQGIGGQETEMKKAVTKLLKTEPVPVSGQNKNSMATMEHKESMKCQRRKRELCSSRGARG
ncbi:Protein Flightless-1 [Manis pentadactyla]|nr:Protein Flightless-1 [Manis pentadactyla]